MVPVRAGVDNGEIFQTLIQNWEILFAFTLLDSKLAPTFIYILFWTLDTMFSSVMYGMF